MWAWTALDQGALAEGIVARGELGDDVVSDESTILRFRHLLEQHRLTATIFEAVRDLLEERRLLVHAGTIVDATIIAAPSATKNATASRDPEMKQTRKGRNWHFGMKLHIAIRRQRSLNGLLLGRRLEYKVVPFLQRFDRHIKRNRRHLYCPMCCE